MKTHFVILSGPRSGSTAFRLWLNSHPLIRCHDEVLLTQEEAVDAITPFFRARGYTFPYDNQSLALPNNPDIGRLLTDFIDSLYSNPQHPAPWGRLDLKLIRRPIDGYDAEQAVGFKFMYYLLDNQLLGKWLDSGRVRIVHLVRDNLLKQYLSYMASKQRNLAHSESAVNSIRLTVDTGTLLQALTFLANGRQKIINRFNVAHCLQVSYEAFCNTPDDLATRVSAFLDVDCARLSAAPLKKLNSDYLPDLIENYDDVARCLEGTPFQHMLGHIGS